MTRDRLARRLSFALPAFAAALTCAVWLLYASCWWVRLDGDAPIYTLMSVRVLEGEHFLMTAMQTYGGTLGVYFRALLFKLFGFSQFLGFYANGLLIAAAAALWTLVACRLGGVLAGLVMAVLCAVVNDRFVLSMTTDYYALAMVLGGLSLVQALVLARRARVSVAQAVLAGLLTGYSLYSCRFSLLYVVSALVLYLSLLPRERRLALVPALGELGSARYALALVLGLAALAYFSSDRFLGLRLEVALGALLALALSVYLWRRWRAVLARWRTLVAFGLGAFVGFVPELIFRSFNDGPDRVTGLSRWRDFVASLFDSSPFYGWKIPPLWYNLGQSYSESSPAGLGLAGFAATVTALALVSTVRAREHARAARFAAFMVALCFAAWVFIHTELPFLSAHLAPALFPIYLLVALVVAHGRFKALGWAAALVLLACGVADLARDLKSPNRWEEPGMVRLVESWVSKHGVTKGFSEFPTTYNLMLATGLKVELANVCWPERFKERQAAILKEQRVFYFREAGDPAKMWPHKGYKVIDHALLDGFEGWLLERIPGEAVGADFGLDSGCGLQ